MNMHLGYVYEENHQVVNPAEFIPAYRAGARLSHAWIRSLRSDALPSRVKPVDLSYLGEDMQPYAHRQWQYSTLDIVPVDAFALFHSTAGTDRARSVQDALVRNGVAVRRLEVGQAFDFTDVGEDATAGKRWVESYGLHEGNVLLIRPDQHVAAVHHANGDENDVVRKVLDMRL